MQRCCFASAICAFALLAGRLPAQPACRENPRQLMEVCDGAGKLVPITTAAQWELRREHALARFQEATGPLPDRSRLGSLDVETVETSEGDGFRRLLIRFTPEVGDRLSAFLYLPTDRSANGRRPAILALHPTSPLGKRVVAGEGPKPNRGYALELAQRGYVVLAPDYPSFGDSAKYDFNADRYVSGTMKGVFNHLRSVDLLCERSEVDAERIGVIGHSLGGHNAIFAALFDMRLKVVVSSCGWTPLHDYYGGNLKGWTSDRYIPWIRDVYGLDPDRVPFDYYELIAALAPRHFYSNSPLRDANFDFRGVRKAEGEARKVYGLYGSQDRLSIRYPDDEHDFPTAQRREAYALFDRVFGHTPRKRVP